MDLSPVDNIDPIKFLIVIFLAGALGAGLLLLWNTQVSPTLRSTLQSKKAA